MAELVPGRWRPGSGRRHPPLFLGELTGRFAAIGLTVNPGKCALWSPIGQPAPDSPLLHTTLGRTQEGSFSALWFRPRGAPSPGRDSDQTQTPSLSAAAVPPQIALTLLRYCRGVQKINHILRVLWSQMVEEFAHEADGDILTALEIIVGSSRSSFPSSVSTCQAGRLWSPAAHPCATRCLRRRVVAGALSPTGSEATPEPEFWADLQKLHNLVDPAASPRFGSPAGSSHPQHAKTARQIW